MRTFHRTGNWRRPMRSTPCCVALRVGGCWLLACLLKCGVGVFIHETNNKTTVCVSRKQITSHSEPFRATFLKKTHTPSQSEPHYVFQKKKSHSESLQVTPGHSSRSSPPSPEQQQHSTKTQRAESLKSHVRFSNSKSAGDKVQHFQVRG